MHDFKANLRVANQEVTVYFRLNYYDRGHFCSFCRSRIGENESMRVLSMEHRGVAVTPKDPLWSQVYVALWKIIGTNICRCQTCFNARLDLMDKLAEQQGAEIRFTG